MTTPVPRPPRIPWEQLSRATQKRYASYYRRTSGYDEQRVAFEYNQGTLGSLSAARGHAITPERRISPEQTTPEQREKYAYYLERQSRRQQRLFKLQTTEMLVLAEGIGEVYVPASALTAQDRKRVYAHRRALLYYLETGNDSKLRRWRGSTVTDWRTGYQYTFMTSLDQVDDMAMSGVDLSYATLYLNVSSTEVAA
jgi:hypothetical protein